MTIEYSFFPNPPYIHTAISRDLRKYCLTSDVGAIFKEFPWKKIPEFILNACATGYISEDFRDSVMLRWNMMAWKKREINDNNPLQEAETIFLPEQWDDFQQHELFKDFCEITHFFRPTTENEISRANSLHLKALKILAEKWADLPSENRQIHFMRMEISGADFFKDRDAICNQFERLKHAFLVPIRNEDETLTCLIPDINLINIICDIYRKILQEEFKLDFPKQKLVLVYKSLTADDLLEFRKSNQQPAGASTNRQLNIIADNRFAGPLYYIFHDIYHHIANCKDPLFDEAAIICHEIFDQFPLEVIFDEKIAASEFAQKKLEVLRELIIDNDDPPNLLSDSFYKSPKYEAISHLLGKLNFFINEAGRRSIASCSKRESNGQIYLQTYDLTENERHQHEMFNLNLISLVFGYVMEKHLPTNDELEQFLIYRFSNGKNIDRCVTIFCKIAFWHMFLEKGANGDIEEEIFLSFDPEPHQKNAGRLKKVMLSFTKNEGFNASDSAQSHQYQTVIIDILKIKNLYEEKLCSRATYSGNNF